MLDRLESLEKEYEAVLARLSDQEVLNDHLKLRVESKRHKELEPIVVAYRDYRAAHEDLEVAKELGMKEEVVLAEGRRS
jgi:peptide chain release factor 1